MRKRTQSREFALQILYQNEFNPEALEVACDAFWERNPDMDQEIRAFTKKIVSAALLHQDEINPVIEKAMEHWDLTRVVLIDKLIMQLAVAEFLFMKNIPPKVTINEAVNLAKKYSQEDSGKFVNGVLDRISHSQQLFGHEPEKK